MSNAPKPIVTPPPPRDRIVAAVRRDGAAAVARVLGVPRSSVVGYCAETARRGTVLAVESNADRLSVGGEAA